MTMTRRTVLALLGAAHRFGRFKGGHSHRRGHFGSGPPSHSLKLQQRHGFLRGLWDGTRW
jgi:hypothetical protein